MATDQGRVANIAGLAMMAALTGRSIPETGTTTYRPPYTPVAIGAFAGPHRGKAFRPVRRTPWHDWAQEQGAVFTEVGPWLRAQYFPAAGEDDWLATVNREVRSVRQSVGFCDVSTLGKIELQGADVGVFLDRLYINTFSTLPVGRARYGVMLREDGFVLDDDGRFSARRRLLSYDDHNRKCGSRLSAHAILSPGPMAGTRCAIRLGNRSMGAVFGCRPEREKSSASDCRSAIRHRQRGISLHDRRPDHRVRRSTGEALPYLVLRRMRL